MHSAYGWISVIKELTQAAIDWGLKRYVQKGRGVGSSDIQPCCSWLTWAISEVRAIIQLNHWQGSGHTAPKYNILSSEKIAEARWCLWPPFPSSPFKDPHVTGVMSCAHEKGRKTQRHIEGSEHTGLLFLPLVNCYWSISPSAHGPSHTRLKCSPPRFSGSSFLKLLLHLRSHMCVLFPRQWIFLLSFSGPQNPGCGCSCPFLCLLPWRITKLPKMGVVVMRDISYVNIWNTM